MTILTKKARDKLINEFSKSMLIFVMGKLKLVILDNFPNLIPIVQ